MDDLNELRALLRESERIKCDLESSLFHDADRIRRINRAYEQAVALARELESKASIEAERIVAEANEKKGEIESRKAEIEDEITFLKEEIQFLQSAIELGSQLDINEISTVLTEVKVTDKTGSTSNKTDPFYVIKLLAFLNARHYVIFGDRQGPVHAHSWQFKVDVEVPSENPNQIAFGDVLREIKKVVEPYENSLLNDHKPFDTLMPTTENLAGVLFERIYNEVSKLGVKLSRLSVWESPTKGIEITDVPKNIYNNDNYHNNEYSLSNKIAAANFTIDDDLQNSESKCIIENNKTDTIKNIIIINFKKYPSIKYIIGGFLIILSTVFIYFNLLFPFPTKIFPWGSDTWGHLFKAEFLYNEIISGNYYPHFLAEWYNGCQPFRYWAPLSYYLIAIFMFITGNIFTAGNLYIVFCAAMGSLFWLLFAGRMGIWPSVMAGILWAIWPDNLKIALQEGNLPRIITTALLPLLLYFFCRTLENKKPIDIFATALILHVIILGHAMLGAAFAICLTIFSIFFFIFRGCNIVDLVRGVVSLLLGVLSSSWWLLPSLSGGISEIDREAVLQIVKFVPALESLNPFLRLTNIEAYYWGISLVIGVAVSIYFWGMKNPWAKSLIVTGIIIMVFTFPISRLLHSTLPLSHLLWPLRFSSFMGMALIASSLTFSITSSKNRAKIGIIIVSLFVVLIYDFHYSLNLMFTKSKPYDISLEANNLKPGWRVATLDLSSLDSPPSYIFSREAGREQVFGWAWQSAVTSNNIMLVNTAIEKGFYPYLFRSLIYLGASDLVVTKSLVKDEDSFIKNSMDYQYKSVDDKFGLWYWHGLDSQYLVEAQNHCLAIGRHASIVSVVFPTVEIGRTAYLDDYSLEELLDYPVLIITGPEWRSKDKAEKLISDYSARGKKVIVDIDWLPEKVLAKQPHFLEVYGENIALKKNITVSGKERSYSLAPFAGEMDFWKSFVPQGLDEILYSFDYNGRTAAVYGYKLINGNKIYFLGANLIYHAFLTNDEASIELARDILGLPVDAPLRTVQLTDYSYGKAGYNLGYNTDRDIDAIIPIAALDGYKISIDGKQTEYKEFENLIRLDLPKGMHNIEIRLEKTGIYFVGKVITVITLIIMAAYMIWVRRAKGA